MTGHPEGIIMDPNVAQKDQLKQQAIDALRAGKEFVLVLPEGEGDCQLYGTGGVALMVMAAGAIARAALIMSHMEENNGT